MKRQPYNPPILKSLGGTPPKAADQPRELARLTPFKTLPKLPEERIKEEEKLRREGPPPKAPKVPKPMNDERAVMMGNLFDREVAYQAAQSFEPEEWDTNSLWLNPDNLAEIQPDKLCVFFGKRRTGKTFSLRHILYTGRALFNNGLVLSNTFFNGFWQKYFPKQYVHEFDPIILDMYLALQKKEVNAWLEAGSPRTHNPYKVIVLDDVVSKGFRYVDAVTEFAVAGRHYRTCVLMTTQYPRLIASSTRSNTDFAFIFFQQNFNERESIVTEYMSVMEKEGAMTLLDKMTTIEEGEPQREVMVINLMANTMNLKTKIRSFEPKDPGEFVVGSPSFWKDDPRFSLLMRKGAFNAWFAYTSAMTGKKQGPTGETQQLGGLGK